MDPDLHPGFGVGSCQELAICSCPGRALSHSPSGLMEVLPVLLWRHWTLGRSLGPSQCWRVVVAAACSSFSSSWAPAARASTQLITASLPNRPHGKEACLNYGCSSKMTIHPHRRNVSTVNEVLEDLLWPCCQQRDESSSESPASGGVSYVTLCSMQGSPSALIPATGHGSECFLPSDRRCT